jgi:hypothetical protein
MHPKNLFNIFLNEAVKEWKQTTQIGTQLTCGKIIQTILYATDQVMLAESEDGLEIAVND